MKAAIVLLLVASFSVDARRIKKRSAGTVASHADTQDVAVDQHERNEEHSEDDWWGAAADAPQTNTNTSLVKQIAQVALFVFNKSMQSASLLPKWNNLKLALNETKAAAEQSAEDLVILKDKLLQTGVLFASSGLQEFQASLNNGAANMSMLGEFFTKDEDESGEADFYQAVESLRSMTVELSQIAESSETVLVVIQGSRDLMTQISELTEAWVSVNMTIFDTLQEQVELALTTLHGLVPQVEEKCAQVKEMMDEFTSGAVEQATNRTDAFKAEMQQVLGELGMEVNQLEIVFNNTIEPLVPQLVAGVGQLAAKAQAFALPFDAPVHVAEEEMGWSGCAWRNTRWFDALEDVDISSTMTCEMEWFGRYRCRCIGAQDCYATEWYRPGPKATKRCFKQVGW